MATAVTVHIKYAVTASSGFSEGEAIAMVFVRNQMQSIEVKVILCQGQQLHCLASLPIFRYAISTLISLNHVTQTYIIGFKSISILYSNILSEKGVSCDSKPKAQHPLDLIYYSLTIAY
jgi:hypothetical protein